VLKVLAAVPSDICKESKYVLAGWRMVTSPCPV